MTRPRRGGCLAVALALGVVLAGCGDGDREDEHLPPDLVDQSQTTSVDADDVASDRARQRVYQWVSGRNTILAQPDHYTTEASIGFAEGTEATAILADAAELTVDKQTRQGETKLVGDPTATKIDLDPAPIKGTAIPPFVKVRACIDESGTHLVNASGAKIKGSEGKGPRPVSFHVLNRNWPNTDTWRIAWQEDIKGSC